MNVQGDFPAFIATKYIKIILWASILVATQPEKKSPAGKIETLPNDSLGWGLEIDDKSTRQMLFSYTASICY